MVQINLLIYQTPVPYTMNRTPLTMAPEILKSENYAFKSDIWSLGIIIYFILNKEYPFNGKNEMLLYDDIMTDKKFKLSSNDEKLNDLIIKMLKININERISWDDYFNHPFFFNFYNNNIIFLNVFDM